MLDEGVGYVVVLCWAFLLYLPTCRRCSMLSSFIAIARYHLLIFVSFEFLHLFGLSLYLYLALQMPWRSSECCHFDRDVSFSRGKQRRQIRTHIPCVDSATSRCSNIWYHREQLLLMRNCSRLWIRNCRIVKLHKHSFSLLLLHEIVSSYHVRLLMHLANISSHSELRPCSRCCAHPST
jgi:hypothetical protein